MKADFGKILIKYDDIRKKWTKYFERLLNIEEDREPEIDAAGSEQGLNVLGEFNEALVKKEEVHESVRETTYSTYLGKASGLDESFFFFCLGSIAPLNRSI